MKRAAILCPGRGSYTEKTLHSLPAGDEWVAAAERLRQEYDLPSLADLDGAERFELGRHLVPANVSPLIYLISMLDARKAIEQYEVVCVAGNSLGWYTALAVGGALGFEDGFRLVQEMSILQQEYGAGGGQVLYPSIDERWRPDPERRRTIEAALASAGGTALPSIELGGYEVLAGSEEGVRHLLKELPRIQLGSTPYPFRLMKHGPYHTPLAEEVARRARETLTRLPFRTPKITLIDGRGARFTPWSTDVTALRDYTLGAQIVTPYSFTGSVRTVLREYAPEQLVLPGPGNTLGGVCGQILIGEGYREIHERADFDRAQASDDPVVLSMRR